MGGARIRTGRSRADRRAAKARRALDRARASSDLVIASVYVPNGGRDYPAKEERTLFEMLVAAGLEDMGRMFDPDNDGLFTWWAPWRNMCARNIGWRLDYSPKPDS
jgi:hypothetical protein